MATTTVQLESQAEALAAVVELQAADVSKLWPRLRGALEEAQDHNFDRGRVGSKILNPATVKARRRRSQKSYYGRYAPRSGVRAETPHLSWTGQVREATKKLTTVTQDRGVVDPSKNYTGPIQGDPFALFVERRVGNDLFNEQDFARRAVKPAQEWLEHDVARVAIRKWRQSGAGR